MRKGKVISLAVSGIGSKIYRSGNSVTENQFPPGLWDTLVDDKHIQEEEEKKVPPPPKIQTIDDVSKSKMEKDLTDAGIGFDPKAKKEVIYELWLTLHK